MSRESIIYRNGRGQIKHYDIEEVSRDGTHIKAIHRGDYKTFRHDSVLEWLDAADDVDSHLAYWRDEPSSGARPVPSSSTTKTKSEKPSKIPFPNPGQASGKPEKKLKKARRPIQWRDFWLGFLFAFALLVALGLFAPESADAKEYGAVDVDRVTSIYDGDTFRVDIDKWPPIVGRRVPVRLRGADTPEMRGKCHAEKAKARAAKQYTVAALRSASQIRLENIERGKYFRIVADVLVDGSSLADELIERDLARRYDGGKRAGWCAL